MTDYHPTDIKELWKPIPEYPGYEVSNNGGLRSYRRYTTPRMLHPGLDPWGRPQTRLRHASGAFRTVAVHALVAAAFLGPRPPRYTINHKDGVRTNNHVDNLEYVTQLENNRHALRLGLREGLKGERSIHALLTDDLVRQIRAELVDYQRGDFTRVARKFGMSLNAITDIYYGRKWKHLL